MNDLTKLGKAFLIILICLLSDAIAYSLYYLVLNSGQPYVHLRLLMDPIFFSMIVAMLIILVLSMVLFKRLLKDTK